MMGKLRQSIEVSELFSSGGMCLRCWDKNPEEILRSVIRPWVKDSQIHIFKSQ